MTANTAPNVTAESYDISAIKVLTAVEVVRRRPHMYVGNPENGEGLHSMVASLAGCMAEVAGKSAAAPQVRVSLHPDGSATIAHNGIGMDVEARNRDGARQVEFWLTAFDAAVWSHHLSTANVLSSRFALTTWWKGREYAAVFAEGEPVETLRDRSKAPPGARGMRIELMPSPEIFPRPRFSPGRMAQHLNELMKLHPDVRFVLDDLTIPPREGMKARSPVQKDNTA